MERDPAKLVLRPNLVETINGRGQRANMPLREGHEFLRGHRVRPSARMSLSPATERGFIFGTARRGSFLRSACRLMISDPREAGFSAKVRLSHPWGQAVPGGIGWGDHRETALGYMCHVRDSSSRCDTRAQIGCLGPGGPCCWVYEARRTIMRTASITRSRISTRSCARSRSPSSTAT